ncbi:MAG: lysophospholipid acyltransferase family protein [Candidatus Rokuibacteriota bacterium]
MLYEFLKPLAVQLMRWMFDLSTVGGHHIPATGPVLLVSNHSSVLDPPLVGGAAARQLSFLAKAELFEIPGFGRLIRSLNARPLRREGADASALREALRMLGEGRALLVFPEGTRGPEGELRVPKAGAGMLAVLSGAPVVPVYISGSGQAWPRGRRFPRRSRVTVTFGPPLVLEGRETATRRERYAEATRAMMAAIAHLRDQVTGTAAADRLPLQDVQAMGGAGATAQSPTHNT